MRMRPWRASLPLLLFLVAPLLPMVRLERAPAALDLGSIGTLGGSIEIRGASFCYALLSDGGVAFFPRANATVGELSWVLSPLDGDLVRVDVNYSFEFSELTYRGRQLYGEALEGNLSFVGVAEVVRVDRVVSSCPSCEEFNILGEFRLRGNHSLLVNASSGLILEENSSRRSRWLLWINPARYSLTQEVREPALYSWEGLDTPVEWVVSWVPLSEPLTLDGLRVTEVYATSLPEDQARRISLFFMVSGMEEPPGLMLEYDYDARTGIFLRSRMELLADDYLYGWAGVAWISCLSPQGRRGILVHPLARAPAPPEPSRRYLYAAISVTLISAVAYILLRRWGQAGGGDSG